MGLGYDPSLILLFLFCFLETPSLKGSVSTLVLLLVWLCLLTPLLFLYGKWEMATHSSILVWGIQRTEEPGRL